jgi:hypothetical protein
MMDTDEGCEYDLLGVPVASVPQYWDRSYHYIQAALDRTEGEMKISDIHQMILNREMQLWLTVEDDTVTGALVTQLIDYPRTKACRYVALGGDLHGDFDKIDAIITEWAVYNKCDRIELVGRRGWTRALKDMGYNEAYSFVTKKVV